VISTSQAVQYTGEEKQTEILLQFFKDCRLEAEFFPQGEVQSIKSDAIFVDTKLGYEPLRVDDYVVVDCHNLVRIVPCHEFETNYV
jgi:hypothetical protein